MSSESSPSGASVRPALAEVLRSALEPHADHAGLWTVIEAIAEGARHVARLTRSAALLDLTGYLEETNVQGEIVARLDREGTQAFVDALRACGRVAALACEEIDETVVISSGADHPFVAVFDPVDGSSNIDVAITIGSIFGIYRRTGAGPITPADLLRPGREQVAAVYAIYGSSTVLVVATREGVQAFTLDPATDQFLLSHPRIRIPDTCAYYSVNEGNAGRWEAGVAQAVAALRRTCSLRYVGSLVADFHRDLLKGGIFLYPGDTKSPRGKLRLVYEGNPLAFVAEQAGGAASDGVRPILDIQPTELHQRTPLIVGNAPEVRATEAAIAAG